MVVSFLCNLFTKLRLHSNTCAYTEDSSEFSGVANSLTIFLGRGEREGSSPRRPKKGCKLDPHRRPQDSPR